jgi:hypothetical protein
MCSPLRVAELDTGEILGTYGIDANPQLLAQQNKGARPMAGPFLNINDVPTHLSTMSRLITRRRMGDSNSKLTTE